MGELLRRRLGTFIVLAVLVLLFSANRLAVIATDWWWFQARGYSSVFTTVLGTRLLLGVAFGLGLAVLIAANLLIARRVRPFFVPSSPQQAQIQRYREMADPYLPWLVAAVAIVFGFTSGLAASASWEQFLLFRNAVGVGRTDPTFDVDIGYYLFQHPFLTFTQTWLFTSMVLTLLLTAGAHYLLGSIRPEADDKVMPAARMHLSILLALLLAVRGWGYWLDRYSLNYSSRGPVTGASFTDVHAELPALYLLMGATVIAILLVLASLRRRGFLFPGAAVGLLLVASVVLQGAYPAVIQRLQVDPQELSRETPYIEYNLEATRAAYGLSEDDVELSLFSISNDLTEQDLIDNDVTLRNVRLWEPNVLETTYQQLQALRPYYQFNRVSIDRYEIDGELRQVMVSTRDLSDLQPGADTWQNRHITFTHGYGVVASQVNTANAQGQPVFLSSNIPPSGADELVPDEQPSVYFGEFERPNYTLVNTEAAELDFEDPVTQAQQVTGGYDGGGGVPIGSFGRRLAFALRFADYNLVLTNLLQDDSEIIFNREVRQRVQTIAPFLTLDGSPYPVVTEGGGIQWIVDAYTTSNAYPYSQFRDLVTAGPGAQSQRVNYVRNSVKVVVDAYTGEVTFYRISDDDPVLDAWSLAFPEMFRPLEEADDSIVRHFRYPQDLFRLQAGLYATYHIQTADAFYNRAGAWAIPRDPTAAVNSSTTQAANRPMEPYYLLMRLPGEQEEEFVLIQPYLAERRENMVAWLAGRSDPGRHGELFAVQFPLNQEVLGPSQAQARIEQEDDIAAYITLRDREGTSVIRGNLQVLPIGDSVLYVEPLFLQADNALIPQLQRVALVLGERVAFDRTFAGALGQLLGIDVPQSIIDAEGSGPVSVEDPTGTDEEPAEPTDPEEPTEPAEPTTPPPTTPPAGDPETVEELLREAALAGERARSALSSGDLAGYQRENDRANELLLRAIELWGIDLEGTAPAAGGS